MSQQAVKDAVVAVFGAQSPMVRIAGCESKFRQFDTNGQVLRGIQNPKDRGIFQVNEKYHLAASRALGYNIYTLQGNIAYAKYIYDHQGTQPWDWSKSCWQ